MIDVISEDSGGAMLKDGPYQGAGFCAARIKQTVQAGRPAMHLQGARSFRNLSSI